MKLSKSLFVVSRAFTETYNFSPDFERKQPDQWIFDSFSRFPKKNIIKNDTKSYFNSR